jgi:hypothetical protein
MAEADRQLSRLAGFVERNAGYVLMIASSMGQAAVDGSQVIRSQLYIDDIGRFMQALGVHDGQWTRHRAMLPRYVFKIAEDAAAAFRRGLSSFSINGEPVQIVELGNGIFQIKLGQENLNDDSTFVRLGGERRKHVDMGLANTPIQDETGSYAYHIPDGILIAYDPAERRGEDRGTISTRDIAPTLLANYGVTRPGYMRPGLG